MTHPPTNPDDDSRRFRADVVMRQDRIELRLAGELDIAARADLIGLLERLHPLLAPIHVDAREVTAADHRGIEPIVAAAARRAEQGRPVLVVDQPSAAVAHALAAGAEGLGAHAAGPGTGAGPPPSLPGTITVAGAAATTPGTRSESDDDVMTRSQARLVAAERAFDVALDTGVPWEVLRVLDAEVARAEAQRPSGVTDGDVRHPAVVTPLAMAQLFADIGRRLAGHADPVTAVRALVDLAVDVVPGARWASVTRGHGDRFSTMAASDRVAADADDLQYRLGTGPCIDAVVSETVFVSPDLLNEDRWAGFGPRAARALGTRSVVSMRLALDTDDDLNIGLNLYADHADAFDDTAQLFATVLAAHAAVAVGLVAVRQTAQQLREALDSNREIGMAIGILMSRLKVTREQAFDLLRVGSQNSNRKLRDIAAVVTETGVLDLPETETYTG